MIWPKEVTLVSRTQPSGPLCLWQCFYFKQVVSGWPSEKLWVWARGAELHKRGGEGGKGRRTNSWHLRLLKYRPAHPLPVLLPDFAFNLLLSRESDAPSWTYSLSRFRVWGCSRQRSSCSWAPPPSWSPSPSRWRQPPLWSGKHPATLYAFSNSLYHIHWQIL